MLFYTLVCFLVFLFCINLLLCVFIIRLRCNMHFCGSSMLQLLNSLLILQDMLFPYTHVVSCLNSVLQSCMMLLVLFSCNKNIKEYGSTPYLRIPKV